MSALNVKARRGMLCVHEARHYYTEQGTNHQVLYTVFHVAKVAKTQGGKVQTFADLATGAIRYMGGMDRVYLDAEGRLDKAKVESLFVGMPSPDFDTLEEARAILRTCEVAS